MTKQQLFLMTAGVWRNMAAVCAAVFDDSRCLTKHGSCLWWQLLYDQLLAVCDDSYSLTNYQLFMMTAGVWRNMAAVCDDSCSVWSWVAFLSPSYQAACQMLVTHSCMCQGLYRGIWGGHAWEIMSNWINSYHSCRVSRLFLICTFGNQNSV